MSAWFRSPATNSAVLRYLPWALGSGLILLAFLFQFSSTRAVSVPVEEDFYRDLGAANGLLQGFTTQDPNLLGETRWYNPLTPWVVATASRVTGISTFDLAARSGPVLNLLAPLALLFLVARIHSVWAACFTLAVYLFLGYHQYPSSRFATYSPWIWPFNFTQGLAFLTLLALHWASLSARWLGLVGAGLLLGITFLSHTAPATLIALSMTLLCVYQSSTGQYSWRQSFMRLTAVGVPSFAVALLLLLPIYDAYRFRMLNHAPANFTALFKHEVIDMLLSWRNLLAIPALLALYFAVLTRRSRDTRLALYLAFTTACAAMFLYGMGVDGLRAKGWMELPLLVPTFHFHLYLTACLQIAFGIGVAWLLERALEARTMLRVGLSTGVLVAMVALAWPGYSHNHDTMNYVSESVRLAQQSELRELYDWCLRTADSDDVFLADDYYGQYSIGASGRKLIVLDPIFTNPYVEHEARVRDRRSLYHALRTGDESTFAALADRYRVRYVLTGPAFRFGLYTDERTDTQEVAIKQLEPVRTFGPLRLYRRVTTPVSLTRQR